MSYDPNIWSGSGRLTKDIELSYTPGGLAIGKFCIANNVYRKGSGDKNVKTSFINVKILGQGAEKLAQYLTKGKPIHVTGEFVQDTWERDGQRHERWFVDNAKVYLLPDGSRNSGGNSGYGGGSQGGGFEDDVPF